MDVMARLPARGVLVVLAFFATFPVFAQQAALAAKSGSPAASAPVRATPTRPVKLWSFVRLRGTDYVSLRDVAERFGFKLTWTKAAVTQTMSDARGVRFNFESNQKDFFYDGARIFLGAPALFEKNTLWVSKLDLIKIVAPLCRPSDHAAYLPASTPRVIVIDPGHGGIDPGAQNLKLKLDEKDMTLDVSLRLTKLLERSGWRVILIRNKDVELSKDKKADLLMRDEVANRNNADIYLSIHFNSAGPSVSGVETYSLAPQFMFSAGDEQGDDMTNVAYPGNHLDYANLLLGEQLHRAMIDGLKTPDRGYKHARKAVLRMLNCPGALVECAYLSNDAEARKVATPEFRQKIAVSLADGLQNYSDALAILRPAAAPGSANR
jgi:N-acetylmuramoyl-L-alanine amidase